MEDNTGRQVGWSGALRKGIEVLDLGTQWQRHTDTKKKASNFKCQRAAYYGGKLKN
jgi:hypothetical protein